MPVAQGEHGAQPCGRQRQQHEQRERPDRAREDDEGERQSERLPRRHVAYCALPRRAQTLARTVRAHGPPGWGVRLDPREDAIERGVGVCVVAVPNAPLNRERRRARWRAPRVRIRVRAPAARLKPRDCRVAVAGTRGVRVQRVPTVALRRRETPEVARPTRIVVPRRRLFPAAAVAVVVSVEPRRERREKNAELRRVDESRIIQRYSASPTRRAVRARRDKHDCRVELELVLSCDKRGSDFLLARERLRAGRRNNVERSVLEEREAVLHGKHAGGYPERNNEYAGEAEQRPSDTSPWTRECHGS